MSNSKKSIDFTKLTDEQLLNLKVDDNNRMSILKEVNRRTKNSGTKLSVQELFNYPKDTKGNKKLEKKFRNDNRKLINKICYAINTALEVNDKVIMVHNIKEFIKVYKESYTLNDYSVTSFRRGNSDKLTLKMLDTALEQIKLFVAGKIK